MDLLDRQLDVELDAVEDVLEIGLLVYIKLQNHIVSVNTVTLCYVLKGQCDIFLLFGRELDEKFDDCSGINLLI